MDSKYVLLAYFAENYVHDQCSRYLQASCNIANTKMNMETSHTA